MHKIMIKFKSEYMIKKYNKMKIKMKKETYLIIIRT